MASSSLKVHALRLLPGMELKTSLMNYIRDKKLKAPFVLTCCGSVRKATLRFAERGDSNEANPRQEVLYMRAQSSLSDLEEIRSFDEHFEICSLVGTFSGEALNSCHLHVTLGRQDGSSLSGHVVGDMEIFTTAEVVLGDCEDVIFDRKLDEQTSYNELVVTHNNDQGPN